MDIILTLWLSQTLAWKELWVQIHENNIIAKKVIKLSTTSNILYVTTCNAYNAHIQITYNAGKFFVWLSSNGLLWIATCMP